MKLQKLIIHNIASIEDATIDFEAQPLADSEVFLITGKTGSGKSTILDAICLALFADTPRLDGTKMQGDTKDGDLEITMKDPRQLMRRNTGEASVTLSFTGSNGVRYESTWSIARAFKKATGNLQPKSWKLKNLDTGYTYSKDKEIGAEIQTAIGLDFNQFCRTTMLAQGEFTRFLNSNDEEKATILEKITGMDIYTKLGMKIFEITSQKEKIWTEAKLQVEATRTLSDDEIAAKEEAISTLEAQYQTKKDAIDKDKTKLQWLKTLDELTKAIAKATEEHKQALTAVESNDFKEKELLVKQWNATIEARSWLAAMKEAEKAISEGKKQIAECEGTIKKEKKTLAETLQPNFDKAQQEVKTAQTTNEQLANDLKSQETELAELHLPELRKKRDEAKELQRNIDITYERIDTHKNEKKRRDDTEKSLKDTSADIEKKQKEAAAMAPLIHDAKMIMDDRKATLDKQSDTIDKFAQTLRQKLHIGDICPVCRQEIKSELPHEEELEQLVGGLREAFTEAEAAHQELVNKKNKLDAEIIAAQNSYQKAKDAFDKDNSVRMAAQKVVEACKACGIETINEGTPKILETLKTETKARLMELESNIAEGAKKEELIKAQRDTLDKLGKKLEELKTAAQKVQQDISDCKNGIAVVEERKKNTEDVHLKQAKETFETNNLQLVAFFGTHTDLTMERLNVLNGHSSQNISALQTSLEADKNNVLTKKTLKDEADRNLEKHSHAKPELNEDDSVDSLEACIKENEKVLTDISEKKGAINQELKTDEENKKKRGQLIEEADQKQADYQKWARMNKLLGDKTGKDFRRIAQSYVLDSLIHSANIYMKTLTDRYTLKVTPNTFVISIEDAYQGYVSRAASTISGGESFLVSLSLALALSDIGQQLAMDTIFIDEGFGTLSGEPLQNAINTLRSLHNKSGRHVGIISHVEELRERIPVQIQVIQQDNKSCSKVEVVAG